MDTHKLDLVIGAFLQKRKANISYYEENWGDRLKREAYYQSFTKEKILMMTEDDFFEYISKLWSMLIWGNKKYVVENLIKNNGFSELKKDLAELLYGSRPIDKRWDVFLKTVKGIGPASISELLSYTNPQEYMLFNKNTILCYSYLGIPNMPKYNYQRTGKKYVEICAIAKEIAVALKKADNNAEYDLLAVDYFLWDEVLPLAEKDASVTEVIADVTEPATPSESGSLHDEIKEKLVDIVNMGKAIYVFEVQSHGSMDSLVLNLRKAQSNPAVQAVVAVSDEEQLEKIRRESIGVIDEKSLRTWNSDDVLAVYDALVRAHESINKLALVPESF